MVLVLSSMLAIIAAGATHRTQEWPEIIPVKKTVIVSNATDPATAGLNLTIRDRHGNARYELRCHNADYEHDQRNYSGVLQCFLSTASGGSDSGNLLDPESRQAKVAWESRGRFLSTHLVPRCAKYPEWGAARTFHLRKMTLTLRIMDVHFGLSGGQIDTAVVESYVLSAAVHPDSRARSARAEAPKSQMPSWFYRSKCQ
jgi:hypothetical protein